MVKRTEAETKKYYCPLIKMECVGSFCVAWNWDDKVGEQGTTFISMGGEGIWKMEASPKVTEQTRQGHCEALV